MSTISDRIREIEDTSVAGSGKNVLIVEGSDDVKAFNLFLDKVSNEWENYWVVAEAGNKTRVLGILEVKSNWIGIVDRDEWTSDIIEQKQQELPNLWVLPRFCLENYLITPDELWRALPEKQQGKVEGGKKELRTQLVADINKWIRHGVLWSVINPLWVGLRSLGFKEALLDPGISLNDEKIQSTLKQWHDFLEPDDIFQQFSDRVNDVNQLPEVEQFKNWIHGKEFYKQVVDNALNNLLGQKKVTDRRISILRELPLPDDLSPLWQKMDL
jgi:hypothetical protein